MTGPKHDQAGGGMRDRRIVFIAALIFLACAALHGFYASFTHFSFYDDEGFMMACTKGYLDGGRLYEDVPSYYGPLYYFYKWFVHSVLSLPLSNDSVRWISIFNWLAAACALAVAGGRLSRWILLPFFIFMQAVYHLTPLVWEPGHPQDLIALLLALSALIATAPQRRWMPLALGAIGGGLTLLKINAGAFFGFAMLIALCSQMPLLQSRRVLFWPLLLLTSALPVLMMKPHLHDPAYRVFCAEACIGVFAAGAMAYLFAGEPPVRFSQLAQALGAFGGVLALVILWLGIRGTSLHSIIDNLIIGPSSLGNAFNIPVHAPNAIWSGAASLIVAVAVLCWRKSLDRAMWPIAILKGVYGILGTCVLLAKTHPQLGYLWPWSWLLLIGMKPDEKSRGWFGRVFICVMAAWQGMQAYATAGTQATVGIALMVLVYSLCLEDALACLGTLPALAQVRTNLKPRTVLMSGSLVLAGLLYVFSEQICHLPDGRRYYAAAPSLGLRGATTLHVLPEQAETYRALTDYVKAECDTFIPIPGLNSLYSWAEKEPPTLFHISEVVLLNNQQQSQVVAALQKVKRPLIVMRQDVFAAVVNASLTNAGPLRVYVMTQCRDVRTIGPGDPETAKGHPELVFHIFKPKDSAAP